MVGVVVSQHLPCCHPDLSQDLQANLQTINCEWTETEILTFVRMTTGTVPTGSLR